MGLRLRASSSAICTGTLQCSFVRQVMSFGNNVSRWHCFPDTLSNQICCLAGRIKLCFKFCQDSHLLRTYTYPLETITSCRLQPNFKDVCRFHPPESFSSFELAEGLYYNNAIETAASAMEMSLIAAKNNAMLAADYLGSQACNDRCPNAHSSS